MTIKIKKKTEFVLDDGPGISDQHAPTLTTLNNGKVVAAWTNDYANPSLGGDAGGTSVKFQIFNASGAPTISESIANDPETGDQRDPSVVALADGGFIVAWTHVDGPSGDGSSESVRMTRFSANGAAIGGSAQVNQTGDTSGTQAMPYLFNISSTKYGFSWISAATGDVDVRMNLYTIVGASAGFSNNITANSQTIGTQTGGVAATNKNGVIMSAWTTSTNIKARLFDTNFTEVQSEVTINSIDALSGIQDTPAIAALNNGRFVVAWNSDNAEDGFGDSVMFRLFKQDGNPVGASKVISNVGAGNQSDVAITVLNDGRFMMVWTSQDGGAGGVEIKGRIFNQNGSAYGNEFLINKTTSANEAEPVITTMRNGQVMVAWTTNDASKDGDGQAAMGRIIDVGSVRTGTNGANTINGDNGRDEVNGKNGNDVIKSKGGNDVVVGGRGNDTILTGKGTDQATGNQGNDRFTFKKNENTTTITDFQNEHDKIDLSAFGYANKAAALNHFNDAGGAHNHKVKFVDKGTTIIAKGIDLAQLDGSDILI
ncbi:MAG: hypothetical protein H6873_03255 [Hyphomicrobiaceae bacterium]|nr:hypothetical protein [Hyphomicrobiaceae bacterium]